jgi:short-subunit dehydrogenase
MFEVNVFGLFAVNGLSDALRLELKPLGVQVSVAVCGNVQTPIWEKGDLR